MSKTIIISILGTLASASFGYSDWVGLRAIDLSAPKCEGTANLNSATEHYFEISNPLPGRDEYNELIHFLEAKNWSQLEENLEIFKKAFETSPLREAAYFLETDALIAQVELGNEDSIKTAEKKVREVLLLYPKSKLVPSLYLSVANMELQVKNYSKALAFFEQAKSDYPFHELNCRFLVGGAESQFLMREEPGAVGGFKAVLQKCSDPLARLISEIRIADIESSKNPKSSLKVYSKLAEKFPARMAKYTPWALFNTGEIKYHEGEFSSAKYYFSEFTKYGKKSECLIWAMKRVADLTVKLKRPTEEGVGAHLAVYDKFPSSDIGKFSRLHAFLIEMESLPKPETERRLKLFDEEIDKLSDDSLRTILFFEKGLALLSLKEKAALPYLVRFNDRKEDFLTNRQVGEYIRKKFLVLLEEEVALINKRSGTHQGVLDNRFLEPLESAYSIWFKGSSQEQKARGLYQSLILNRMKALLEKDNAVEAIARLERWEKSGIWSASGPPREARETVTTSLLRLFQNASEEQRKSYSAAILEKENTLRAFFKGDLEAAWLAPWIASGEKEKVKAFMSTRTTASLTKNTNSKELRSQLLLIEGKAARYLRRYEKANLVLKNVDYPNLVTEAKQERFQIAKEMGKPELMLEIATELRPHSTTDEYIGLLRVVVDTVSNNKSWGLAPKLYQLAEKANIEKKKLIPFLSLKGRAEFEGGNYKKAIDSFETALAISPNLENEPGLKFRLGKSYFKTRQNERARKQWEELSKLKDDTWSPLAETELKLLQ